MSQNDQDINLKYNMLQNDIVSYVKSRVLIISAQKELHKHITEKPISIENLSNRLNFNVLATLRMLKLLEAMHLLQIIDDNWVIETKYTCHLSNLSSEHYYKGYIAFEDFQYSLEHNKECWSHKFGESFYDYLNNNPNVTENIANYCEITGKDWLPSVLDFIDLNKHKKLIDIGSGKGYFMSLILKKFPHLTGTLFDFPHMITQAEKYYSHLDIDIQKRIAFVYGNFFDEIPCLSDAYLFCRIFLNWNKNDALRIINNASRSMNEDSEIIIVDFILPEKNHPHYERAVLHDLNLFAIFGGSIRSQRDWEELIAESELKIKKFDITSNNIDHEPNVPLCCITIKK